MIHLSSAAGFKLLVAAVLYIFLPLTALTYYFSRRQRRVIEVTRVTANVLVRAVAAVRTSPELIRLREVGQLAGTFWARTEPPATTAAPQKQPLI